MFQQLGLIGCGLMGGSLALALREAGLVKTVVGFSQSPASSAKALTLGVIDRQVFSAADAAADSDLVVIAVPVAATQSTLAALLVKLPSDAVVIDVGSTKADVISAAALAMGEKLTQFVPCHPVAGAEKSGVDHASAALYRGCQVIMTPDSATAAALTTRVHAMWLALGCKVVTMTAPDHDAAFAKVSHLPHLLAFAYINGILKGHDPDLALRLAGTGFRDFSRIAASEPHMWRDILLANRTEVLASLALFEQEVQVLRHALELADAGALFEAIARSSASRSAWKITNAS